MYSPKFTITNKITQDLIKIEKLKQKIDLAKILPQQMVRLRKRATVDEIHSSTSIEGNQLNKKQVEQVVAGKLTSQEYAVIEVLNYKKALDWINKNLNQLNQISNNEVLSLHNLVAQDLLPKSKVGQFRKGPIYVIDIENNKEVIRYEGPKAKDLNKYLQDLFIWLNQDSDLHSLIKAAILHYEFVSIHPFSDGNGRVTRLLVKLFLYKMNYDFKGGFSLDSYFLENRQRYYEELNLALNYEDQREADLTEWIEFFLTGFLIKVEKLAYQINLMQLVDFEQNINFSEEELVIIDYLVNFGEVRSVDVAEMLQTTERTAQRKLKDLVEKKVIKVVGEARNTKYRLNK
jgi:Fic family protein